MSRVLDNFPTSTEVDSVERVIRELQRETHTYVTEIDVMFQLPIGFSEKKLQRAISMLIMRNKGLYRPHYGFLSYRDLE
jgi:hypothetical protein